MLNQGVIISLIVAVAVAVVLVRSDLPSAPPPVSSIVVTPAETEIQQQHEQVAFELDAVDQLLDAAAAPASPAAGAAPSEEPPASEAGIPVSLADPILQAELVAYERVRDARHAVWNRGRRAPPPVLHTAPVGPAPSSLASAGRGAAGISVLAFRQLEPAVATIARRPLSYHGSARVYSAPGIPLARLAYFALRNGYHGGEVASQHQLLLSRQYFVPRRLSCVLAPAFTFPFSHSYRKAVAFKNTVMGQRNIARDSQIQFGDVA